MCGLEADVGQWWRAPGKNRSISGTKGEKQSSDQIGPLDLKSTNWTNPAPAATSAAKRMRPRRESGVVRGSEIMWKEKMRRVPLWS